MNRILIVILTAWMLLFIGCNFEMTANTAPEAAETAEPTPEAAETAEPVPEQTAAPDEPITPGVINGNTYINVFFNLGCALNEWWSVKSEHEIAEIHGSADELLSDEEYRELLRAEDSVITEFYATAQDGAYSINTNVSQISEELAESMDESAYIDAAIEGEQNLVGALESMGMENVQAEKQTVTVAGRETYAARVSCEYQETPFYEMVVAIKRDSYFLCITTTSVGEDYCMEMLGLFVPIV